jgi:hypothetical protein
MWKIIGRCWIILPGLTLSLASQQPPLVDLKKAAETGDPKAQLLLADRYRLDGKSLTAETWYRKAAETGLPEALDSMGDFYVSDQYDREHKRRIIRNPTNAVTFYSLGAGQGFHPSQLHFGMRLYEGVGIKRDPVRAYQMLRLSGEPGARYYLDKLILELSQSQIDEGEKLAKAFKPKPFQEVLSELIAEHLHLNGVVPGTTKLAIINGKSFREGESADVVVKGFPVRLRCESIGNRQVVVNFQGRQATLLLP